jgi:hypothetical protein
MIIEKEPLMATWAEFATARPDMAELLKGILEWIPITYLATVRRNGDPRVHPVCPTFADGRMFIAVNETSPKRLDLANDGRFAMHALPGKWREVEGRKIGDDEFYITGRARRVDGSEVRAAIRAAAGHEVNAQDWLFGFDIKTAMTAYWEKVGQPGTYAVRQFWRDGE